MPASGSLSSQAVVAMPAWMVAILDAMRQTQLAGSSATARRSAGTFNGHFGFGAYSFQAACLTRWKA